ncbi:hypothetical protein J7L13_03305 [bacterium]|nr:hypothetical protein [bacterium]
MANDEWSKVMEMLRGAVPDHLIIPITNTLKKAIEPKGYVEVAKRYGTEAAPIPPATIIALAANNPIASSIGFGEFILEEAMQMTSFGLMSLLRLKEYDTAKVVLDQLENIWKYGMTFHETLGKTNPITYVSFGLNYSAVASMILADKFIIKKNTDPDVIAKYQKLEDWYNDLRDEIYDQRTDELQDLKKEYDKSVREISNERSKKLKEIMDLRKAKKITYEEWFARRSKIYDEYNQKRAELYSQYLDLKDKIYDKYAEILKGIKAAYDSKIRELDYEVMGEMIEEDPEIFYSIKKTYEQQAAAIKSLPLLRSIPKWLVNDLSDLADKGIISDKEFTAALEALGKEAEEGATVKVKDFVIARYENGLWQFVSEDDLLEHFSALKPSTQPSTRPETTPSAKPSVSYKWEKRWVYIGSAENEFQLTDVENRAKVFMRHLREDPNKRNVSMRVENSPRDYRIKLIYVDYEQKVRA